MAESPIPGGVDSDDDDFGSFEDAVTGTEDDPQPSASSLTDQKDPGEAKTEEQEAKNANGSSTSAAGLDHFASFASAQSVVAEESSKSNNEVNGSGEGGLSLPSPDKVAGDPAFSSSGGLPPAPPSLETGAILTTEPSESVRAVPGSDGAVAGTDEKKEDEDADAQPPAVATMIGGDDDPFGAFDSVPTLAPEPAASFAAGDAGDGVNDDQFVAFDAIGGGVPEQPPTALNGDAAIPPEKDLAAAPVGPERDISAVNDAKQDDDDEEDDNDGFGSFDDAVMVEPPPEDGTGLVGAGVTENSEEDVFSAFSDAGEHGDITKVKLTLPEKVEKEVAPAPTTDDGNDGDEGDGGFGDFGTFEDVSTTSHAPGTGSPAELAESTKANGADRSRKEATSDDGFGGFDTFGESPSAVPSSGSAAQGEGGEEPLAAKKSVEEVDIGDEGHGDGFGDFSSFNKGSTESTKPEGVNGDSAIGVPEDKEGASEDVAAAGDIDFGDFGSFNEGLSEGQNEEAVVTAVAGKEGSAGKDHKAEGGSDDNFGDFSSSNENNSALEGSGVPAHKAAEGPIEEKEKEDEDAGEQGLGDSGDSDGNKDDDFGGFEDAAPPAGADEPPTDEDQPNEVPSLPSASDSEPNGNGDHDDDDFGDFGDFDEAQVPTTVEEDKPSEQSEQPPATEGASDDDDFGDFGGFDDSAAAAPEPLPLDPFVAKTEAVLGRVFSGFAIDTAKNVSLNEEDGEVGSATLESLLSAIAGPTSEKRDIELWSKRQVEAVLSDLEKDLASAPPSVISNHDVPRPYAHYAIPMGGLHLSEDGSPTQGEEGGDEACARGSGTGGPGSGKGKPVVPDVLSINLPTGPESPSPPRKPKPAALSMQEAATVAALPPVGGEEREGIAARTETTLAGSSKITDAERGENANFGNGKPEKTPVEQRDSSGDFDADFGGFESAEDPLATAAGADNSEGMSAACKDFLRQIPDLSFMLKSSLSLPTGSQNS